MLEIGNTASDNCAKA